MQNSIGHFIDGKLISTGSSAGQDVFNPASGAAVARVELADVATLDGAVAAAKAAFPAWLATPALRRARIIDRFRGIIADNINELACAISTEHGKTHEDALGEIARGVEVLEFACGAPHLIKGEFSENVGRGVDCHSIRQPLGVVAGISPFNFPVMVPMWMFPLALVCGNCFILKPSERDPSASLLMARYLKQAGLPDGVFNVVQGDKVIVDAILDHADIKAVSFVGSTPVARHIYLRSATAGKRVQALGGAKNHMVIMPDADLDLAASSLLASAFGSAGERCMAISVAVAVTDQVADSLLEKLVPKIKALKIGAAHDPSKPVDLKNATSASDAEMGPLVTKQHLERVKDYVAAGVKEGAQLVVDGRELRITDDSQKDGFFLGGCLFDKVKPNMTIYQDEIFGPVLCVVRCKDYQSAIDLIHAHRAANGVAVFTRSGGLARDFSSRIEVGMVGVNVPIPVPMAFHSFGGWKDSLFGDHAVYGMEGIRFYTRLKTITSRWPDSAEAAASLAMPVLG